MESMKPDWKDAPEWANWLSQSEIGTWCWHENKPRPLKGNSGYGVWLSYIDYKFKIAVRNIEVIPNWKDTLEKRPEK